MTLLPLRRILLVEDDPDIQEVAVMALREFGEFTVEVCSSGVQALEAAPGFGPDIILLDVMMPGMDGPTTLRQLRGQPGMAHVPVIFLTARSQPREVAEYKELGAIEVITKPFDPIELPAQVTAAWTRHHG